MPASYAPPGYHLEPIDEPPDARGLAAECDAYAAEARALRRQLAEANAREMFLNDMIGELRVSLAAFAKTSPSPACPPGETTGVYAPHRSAGGRAPGATAETWPGDRSAR